MLNNPAYKAGPEQAFALQYITLMIIILAVLVGTFSIRSTKSISEVVPQPDPIVPVAAEAPAQTLSSELIFEDLFDKETSAINEVRALAITQLLSNHDLDADLTLNLGFCSAENLSEACFKKELQAAREIESFLTAGGVPAGSVKAFFCAPGYEPS